MNKKNDGYSKIRVKNSVLLRGLFFWLLLPVFLLMLNSCIGISADIQMRKDGSGKIIMEYRFSRMSETIGRLDGNERWQIIPTGRADFERTIARIDGMKLVSFSGREDSKDIINMVTLEFKNTEALLKFLDPSGKRAALSRENGTNKLRIVLNEPASQEINADLLDLMKQQSAGYRFSISFSAEGTSAMTITNGAGAAITPPQEAEATLTGKKVSISIGTGGILDSREGLEVNFIWD